MSLSACGSGEDAGTMSAVDNSKKEEMLADAQLLDLSELFSDVRMNKARAEETYIGNSYKIFVFVDQIESDYFEYQSGSVNLRVYLSKEELKQLHAGEGINIVGVIDSFEEDYVNIKTAYYVDNLLHGVYIVNTFLSDSDRGDACIADSVLTLNGMSGKTGYRIFLDGEALSALKEADFILVSGTAYKVGSTSVGPYSYSRELRDAQVIVKGQDEIVAYFEKLDQES